MVCNPLIIIAIINIIIRLSTISYSIEIAGLDIDFSSLSDNTNL